MRVPFISLLAAGALALGGCAYGDLGVGYGSGYGSYGYGGYGSYGDYGRYGGGYGYLGTAYGYPYGTYGSSYYGWNDGYYYPGTGYYVYDSYRQPHTWTSSQRDYWTNRQKAYSSAVQKQTRRAPTLRQDWSGFTQQQTTDRATRKAQRTDRTRH